MLAQEKLVRQAGIPLEKGFLIWGSWMKSKECMIQDVGGGIYHFANWNLALPSIMIMDNNYNGINITYR